MVWHTKKTTINSSHQLTEGKKFTQLINVENILHTIIWYNDS